MSIALWKRSGRTAACALIIGLLYVTPLAAQPSGPSNEDRLKRLEERFEEAEKRHAEDLRTRDEEIARLRGQLGRTTQPASAIQPPEPTADKIEQTRQDILGEIESRQADPFSLRTPANFNPNIAVIGDFIGSHSSNRSNDALNRVDVREVELDMRAAVDPRADGVLILAFERDAENPVFPEGEPLEGPESSVNIEEAYLFLHDFGVPNLTAKVGRFNVRFGRQNVLHLHDLPTSDPSLVNQAFLSPEALTDGGISLSYLLPVSGTGGEAVELIGELLAGEGAGSESATLTGDIKVDSPGFNFHALWNTNLSPEWNLELGGSFLTAPRGPDNSQRANLYGLDATFLRRDPTGGFRNTILQSEFIFGDLDQEDGGSNQSWGTYLLAQQQLNRDWYLGLRLDYTQDPNDEDSEVYGFSPYVSWYWSEFLRLRLQYQYKTGDVRTENNLFFQVTWLFGAHPPHPYWSMQ